MIRPPITRAVFIGAVPRNNPILEIGPYAKPVFTRPDYNVYYADLYTAEQILNDTTLFGVADNINVPDKIDIIINPTRRPTISTDLRFDYIFSSHNIEHVPDIVAHLQEMATVVTGPNAKYLLAIPDHQHCFDHWQTTSLFPQMIAAYQQQASRASAQSALEYLIFEAHNDSIRHWKGDHGESPYNLPIEDQLVEKIKTSIEKLTDPAFNYSNAHVWRFTPNSFVYNMEVLNKIGLIPWKVNSVFETEHGANEFFAILELS